MTEPRDTTRESARPRGPAPNDTSSTLTRLTAEARDDARAHAQSERADWRALDEQLFARIDRDEATLATVAHYRGSRAAWGILAAVTAAAAAILVLVGGAPEECFDQPTSTASLAPSRVPSVLLREDTATGPLVNGQPSSRSRPVAVGDIVETRGARAVFAEKGAVTWALESATKVSVGHATGPLVLALERGTVEAQVAHVDRGEAFAVDVEGTRIAVHGTHLRVERTGDRVVVDLSEGVISVGAAPVRGSTYGSLVTAPAHVEFKASDPRGSLRVEHAIIAVRGAASLPIEDESAPQLVASVAPSPILPTAPPRPAMRPSPPRLPSAPPPDARREPVAALASPPIASSQAAPSAEPLASAPDLRPTPPELAATSAALAPAMPARAPEMGVAGNVRACWKLRATPNDIARLVQTTLTVDTGEDGGVRLAHFKPALPADVEACAAGVIYKTRFAGAARVVIPITLTR